MRRVLMALLVLSTVPAAPGLTQIEVEEAFLGLGSFSAPVDLQNAGDGSNRLFVVEQRGVIKVFANDAAVQSAGIFLDIQDRVLGPSGEQGLLGLAFHPDYATNGYFYVNYSASSPRRNVISRFSVSAANPDSAVAASELVLLEIAQPFSNHNGGQIGFPPDGASHLYIASGDGGDGGDPLGHGQNRATLLGAILRIDVDSTEAGLNYSIPADNPFAQNSEGFRREIYAYGLRNPWRFSFDPETGLLWTGDVGQNRYEEIDIIKNGGNYGWNIQEAAHCYPSGNSCDTTGLEPPVWEYAHSQGVSITGGHVYRGPGVPGIQGRYIYADWFSGRIWALTYDGSAVQDNTQLIRTSLRITSFGVAEDGELYFLSGRIYRFKATTTTVETPAGLPRSVALHQNYPNPFNPETRIDFELRTAEDVELAIYDLQGRLVRVLDRGFRPAGAYTRSWDGRGEGGATVPSGVYIYRLQTSAGTFVRKLSVVR